MKYVQKLGLLTLVTASLNVIPVFANQCPSHGGPEAPSTSTSTNPKVLLCPNDPDVPESGRDYGALVRLRGTAPNITEFPLYEGGDSDPFDGTIFYDYNWSNGDGYVMRVVCGTDTADSSPVSRLKTHEGRSTKALPPGVVQIITKLRHPDYKPPKPREGSGLAIPGHIYVEVPDKTFPALPEGVTLTRAVLKRRGLGTIGIPEEHPIFDSHPDDNLLEVPDPDPANTRKNKVYLRRGNILLHSSPRNGTPSDEVLGETGVDKVVLKRVYQYHVEFNYKIVFEGNNYYFTNRSPYYTIVVQELDRQRELR